ncbi:MAG TPA: diaminopimelate epimerase, partial [Thiotrichales bacterium]|nr:diaminopimelate epimerase [Thiotrichales bacterium]
MAIRFTKMHGLGNDFMVIDAINQSLNLDAEQVRQLADRHVGVGFDQLLLVEKPQGDEAEFRYRIFNADGGEVEQCGNGARCFAVFVRDEGLTASTTIPVETAGGLIRLQVNDNGEVTVDMGEPDFSPASLPFSAEPTDGYYMLTQDANEYRLGVVSMGNPHAVLQVDSVESTDVATIGAQIGASPRFPQGVNVG